MKCFFTALFKFIKYYKQKAAFDHVKSGFSLKVRWELWAFHNLKELFVGFRHGEFIDKEFHRFHFTHWVKDFA